MINLQCDDKFELTLSLPESTEVHLNLNADLNSTPYSAAHDIISLVRRTFSSDIIKLNEHLNQIEEVHTSFLNDLWEFL